MTENKKQKRLARERATKTGESYETALEQVRRHVDTDDVTCSGVLEEDIERVREAADFVQIVSEVAQLQKVGRRWQGLCPFHAETSPSFSVNADEKLYYCFGCTAGGNLFRFVQETQHLDFAGSVEWIAAKNGITLRYDS